MDLAGMIMKTTADHFEKEFKARNEYLRDTKKKAQIVEFYIRNPELRTERIVVISQDEMLRYLNPFEEFLVGKLFPKA